MNHFGGISKPAAFSVLLVVCALGAFHACTGRAQRPIEKDNESTRAVGDPELTQSLNVLEGFRTESVQGYVGNAQRLDLLGDGCVGVASTQPSVHLYVANDSTLRVHARPLESEDADLVMAIQSEGGGVLCSDDVDGLNPKIDTHFEAGQYKLWVGTFEDDPHTEFELHVEDALHGLPKGPEPQPIDAGTYGGLSLGDDTGPGRLIGRAGGTRQASDIGPGCVGFIGMRPDHVLTLSETVRLRIAAHAADADLVLLLQDGQGRVFCNDDAEGANPALHEEMDAGTWNVYVGTYAPSSYPEYVLRVSR